jgi:hypothetical protein
MGILKKKQLRRESTVINVCEWKVQGVTDEFRETS